MNLRHRLRKVADWCVGPRLEDELVNLWTAATARGLSDNRRLIGRHGNEQRCFVIGNGPSLRNMDLKLLAQEYTIGANSFYKHPDASAVRLDYLCIFDPHFMADEPRAVDWHRTLAEKLPFARFVLHEAARSLVRRHGLYSGREVYFVRRGRRTLRAASINLDPSRPLNIGVTTGSSVAIPLALCLGFREIYLIGFDCNWLEETNRNYHFYDSHEHFPEFDSLAKDNRGFTYEDFLRYILGEFEGHRLLRERADQLGVHIVNATEGGLLEAYDRKPYMECLGAGRPGKTGSDLNNGAPNRPRSERRGDR